MHWVLNSAKLIGSSLSIFGVISASIICGGLPRRLERCPFYTCVLSVVLFALKTTFLVPFQTVISLATCHAFLVGLCGRWLHSWFCPWGIDVFRVNIVCIVLSCNYLVPSCFPWLPIALQSVTVLLPFFFVQYNPYPKAPNGVSPVFFEHIFLLHSRWLPRCSNSSWLLFLQMSFFEGFLNALRKTISDIHCVSIPELSILCMFRPVIAFDFVIFLLICSQTQFKLCCNYFVIRAISVEPAVYLRVFHTVFVLFGYSNVVQLWISFLRVEGP